MAHSLLHNTRVSVTVQGRNLVGPWKAFGGGETTGDMTKTFAGGGLPEVVIGGIPSVADITVTALYQDELRAIVKWLRNGVGAFDVIVSQTDTDAEGNALGTQTWTGKLAKVTPPEGEAGKNDAAEIELMISTNGIVL